MSTSDGDDLTVRLGDVHAGEVERGLVREMAALDGVERALAGLRLNAEGLRGEEAPGQGHARARAGGGAGLGR